MTDREEKREALRQRLKGMKSLPTLPPIVSRLNELVEDEEVTAEELGKIIEKDQVLTSKLLKMVNSSFFGFPQRISTVANAIVLLGFNVIKTLVVTSSIFEVMQSSDVGLWEHSLGCATAAGIISRRHNIKNPEEISTAGLIHDIGKVVVRSELPDEYSAIMDKVLAHDTSMLDVELELLGVGHGEIGGWLAEEWNLPPRLSNAIEWHHDPERAGEYTKPAAIIHFSDILVRAVGFGFGGDRWVPPLNHSAWSLIKFSRSEMKELLAELEEKLVDLQNFTLEFTA